MPWPITAIDPHRLDDVTAAVFGPCLFDTLYARDEAGTLAPSLAEADPEAEGTNLRVRLRAGVRTGRGKAFEPRDARDAIQRARSMGARGWLSDIPVPKVDGRSLVFATRDVTRLTLALSSPLVAMVPSGYTPEAPDGTGPMRLAAFAARGDSVVLTRNPVAARGPSLLDEIVVRKAPDLAASLRAFESGTDDLGWHGSGLHDTRAGSRTFDFGAVGWAVLFTGRDAQTWDNPGVAQSLCDGLPPSRFSYLALGAAWPSAPSAGWGGPPTGLLVRDDSPWLLELARVLAATLSTPSHEVTVRPVPAQEIAQRRSSRLFALMLDAVRAVAPGSLGAMVSLASADNPERAANLVAHPPKLGEAAARTLTRTMRCGVVGDLRVQGGRAGDVQLAAAWPGFDLGASSRARR